MAKLTSTDVYGSLLVQGNSILEGKVSIGLTSGVARLQVKSGSTTEIPLIVDAPSGQSTHLQSWRVNGNDIAILESDSGFRISQLRNRNTVNNSLITLGDTGTIISRNIADANTALTVNQANASSTGHIQKWQFGGTDKAYVTKDGAFYAKDLVLTGDLTVQGTVNTVYAEDVYTENDYIYLRNGAVSGLPVGTFAGIVAKKADGTNDAELVFDGNGIARVGDTGSTQALATREDAPVDTGIPFWNATANRFDTNTDIKINNAVSRITAPQIYATSIFYGTTYHNPSNSANAYLRLLDSGTNISRNIADANPALIVNQVHASSTGDILKVQAAGTDRLTVKRDGKVGIGTTTPSEKLDVNGNVNISTGSKYKINGVNLSASDVGAEPSFSKNTAFNKNFGTTDGTVAEGNDSRLSDARTPLAHTHGYISDTGAITASPATPASGDYIVIADNSDSSKLNRSIGIATNDGTFLRHDGAWATPPDTTYNAMTSTVYGLGKLFSDTAQSVAANAVSATASRTYGVQANASGQLVVNVPWEDNNTVYTHPTFTRSDTTSSASPAHGGTFTVVDSVTSNNGHVTAINLKTITLPDDNDIHWTSKNIVGASNTATANATATNGNVHLNHLEGSTVTSAHKIIGSGATTVVSDASGNITISSTDNNTLNTAGSTDTSSKIFLVGASTQAANPQTYSDNEVFATDGVLNAKTFTSTVATGTAPLVVTSTTAVANLQAATATKLHTTRAITVGPTAKNFDGSAAITYTLAEIGINVVTTCPVAAATAGRVNIYTGAACATKYANWLYFET